MREILVLGNRIYHHRDHTDFNIQRLIVFWLRGLRHQQDILALSHFFQADSELRKIESGNAIFYEEATRQVFYYQSTLPERAWLIRSHFDFCRQYFSGDSLQAIYYDGRLPLWEEDSALGHLSLGLDFHYVDRKEGLMSIDLLLNEERLYHITFLFEQESDGSRLRIGAMQGCLGAQDSIHALTKAFFGFRPKNLILHAIRLLAQELNIKDILAVSNLGFFTSNHVRLDRKLKTDLDCFWQENQGQELPTDPRFYILPVTECRKPLAEVKSHKRSQYRKRYALLDSLDETFRQNLRTYLL